MQQSTRSYLNNLTNNLKNLDGIASVTKEVDISQVHPDDIVADEKYFQILLVEINNESKDLDFSNLLNMEESGDVTTTLIYGKKKDLIRCYPGINSFPSPGVEVDPTFISLSTDERDIGVFTTVRFLLQCRKLSQMMAFTWVNEDQVPDDKKIPVKLVREIFQSTTYKQRPCSKLIKC